MVGNIIVEHVDVSTVDESSCGACLLGATPAIISHLQKSGIATASVLFSDGRESGREGKTDLTQVSAVGISSGLDRA